MIRASRFSVCSLRATVKVTIRLVLEVSTQLTIRVDSTSGSTLSLSRTPTKLESPYLPMNRLIILNPMESDAQQDMGVSK